MYAPMRNKKNRVDRSVEFPGKEFSKKYQVTTLCQ